MPDTFFNQEHCDRCENKLVARTMSWFTNETICMDCSIKEKKLRKRMREAGLNDLFFEGCGYIPTVPKKTIAE